MSEDGDECPAAFWSIKPLSSRFILKAATYGGVNQITDVLRGSVVCESAAQLLKGLDGLFAKHRHSVRRFNYPR